MKSAFAFIVTLLCVSGVIAQSEDYSLKGKVSDSAYEGWEIATQIVLDTKDSAYLDTKVSAKIVNGKFEFTGNSKNLPEMALLTLINPNNEIKNLGFIIIEKGKAELNIDEIGEVIIKTPLNLENQAFRNRQIQLVSDIEDLKVNVAIAMRIPLENYTEQQLKKDEYQFDSIRNMIFDNVYSYVKKNIKNRVGEFHFITTSSYLSPERMKELYTMSSPQFQKAASACTVMEEKVWSKEGFNVGDAFKDIELMNADGKMVKLSDYTGKGKIVLVDFWASWCGPCRKEMPLIVSLYEQYKDKGFEVVGISLDENKSNWISSIKNMNMTWPQLSDLGGWGSKAAKIYKISRVPQNFLLDGEGKIIVHDLHGNQLKTRLAELFEGK